MSPLLRALALVPCLLLGANVSACTVLLHDYWWGLALGLATTAAVLVALPGGWWSRLPAALGWVAILAVAVPERTEGDLLISGDASGYLLLAAGVAVFVSGFVGLVRRPARAAGAAGAGEDADR